MEEISSSQPLVSALLRVNLICSSHIQASLAHFPKWTSTRIISDMENRGCNLITYLWVLLKELMENVENTEEQQMGGLWKIW